MADGDFFDPIRLAKGRVSPAPETAKELSAYRRRLVQNAADVMKRPDWVYLPSVSEYWQRKGCSSHWVELPHEEVKVLMQTVMEELQGGDPVHTQMDTLMAIERLKTRLAPRGRIDVAPSDMVSHWHLDTGESFRGTVVQNGIISLDDDGTIRVHPLNPRIFNRTALPFSWIEQRADPPANFAGFLERMQPTKEERNSLCAAIGAMLVGEMHLIQAFVLLAGVGRSGKGTMARLITMLMGEDNVRSVRSPSLLASRFATSSLVGKTMLLIEDMPNRPTRGSGQAEFDAGIGLIKNLTGGDRVDIEAKYGQQSTAKLDISVLVASNFEINWARDADDLTAWTGRVLPFIFDHEVPADERVPNFEDVVLKPELDQIFAYCVTRYAKLKAGLGRVPSNVDFHTERIRSRLDQLESKVLGDVAEFVRTRVERGPGFISQKELKQEYSTFSGIALADLDRRQVSNLYATMRERLGAHDRLRRVGGKPLRGFEGVTLIPDDDAGLPSNDEPFI